MMYHLLGCGGIGAWVAQSLSKTLGLSDYLCLWDGDKIETRNLDRQLFSRKHVGVNKAEALASTLSPYCQLLVFPKYFTTAAFTTIPTVGFPIGVQHILLAAVDNMTARKRILECVDAKAAILGVLGANEYDTAEAYVYQAEWQGTPLDPRVFYQAAYAAPDQHDPLHPACTGEAQEAAPQLALANQMAASYVCWLLRLWTTEATARQMPPEAIKRMPYHIYNTFGRIFTKSPQGETTDG